MKVLPALFPPLFCHACLTTLLFWILTTIPKVWRGENMHVLLFPHKAEKIHTAKHVGAGMHHTASFYRGRNSGCLLSELLFPKLLKKLFISNGVIQIIKDITCLQGFYYWKAWSSVHCTFWNLIHQTESSFLTEKEVITNLVNIWNVKVRFFFSICDIVCDM